MVCQVYNCPNLDKSELSAVPANAGTHNSRCHRSHLDSTPLTYRSLGTTWFGDVSSQHPFTQRNQPSAFGGLFWVPENALHKPAADQIERLLAGPGANVFPVPAETAFHYFGLLAIGNGDVNEAYGLFFRAAARTGDAGDAEAKGRRRVTPNPLRQGPGYLLADRAVPSIS